MLVTGPQARILGSLIEKQLTTPSQYPLTLNSLVLACNQSSNRDPVVTFDEPDVLLALDSLREHHLVRTVLPSAGRSAVRYRHVIDEVLGLDASEIALLAVLMLRGKQTPGELRTRCDRMCSLSSVTETEIALLRLAQRDEPLVARIPRRAGQKEDRWCELLSNDANQVAFTNEFQINPPQPSNDQLQKDLATISLEVASLREDLGMLRTEFDALRKSLGD